MKNEFSEETRSLFIFNYECWKCGSNKFDALHHIMGRVSSSPLNAAPICNLTCHIGQVFSEEDKKMMLQKTFKWLCKVNYKFTHEDGVFACEHKKYYEGLITLP